MKNFTQQQREELLLAALYEELSESERSDFEELLQKDSDFAKSYTDLQKTASFMSQREKVDPGEAFWQGYWDKLEPQLQETPTATRIIKLPNWAYQTVAAAAILLLGVFIGRSFMQPPRQVVPIDVVQAAAIEARTDAYLERSKVLLLGLVNMEQKEDLESLNFQRYQNVSRKLLNEGGHLKEAFQQPGKARLRQLVSDLEIILMQIANLDAQEDFTAIEMLQTGVERRGIMLKINLEEMQRDPVEEKKTMEIL
ncbi:MAG: hypothetical protein ACRBF0_24120 [Calditrichia bacterium]